MAHYIGMSGDHGCLPDNCFAVDTLEAAVDSLAQTFELGRNRKRDLKRYCYLELNSARDGAQYVEIEECTCNDIDQHNDDPMSDTE